MRKKRDAEGTKRTVLESAERLFADSGFKGTSLAGISEASGISEGLILYHFKSKERLYTEVMERISTRYLNVLMSLRETDLPPRQMMEHSLKTVFDFWKNDTTYHRLSLWAYLEHRERPIDAEARLTGGLAAYLSSLKQSGHLPERIHPAVFLSMTIGAIHFWFRYKTRFAEILQMRQSEERLDELFVEQLTGMLAGIVDRSAEQHSG